MKVEKAVEQRYLNDALFHAICDVAAEGKTTPNTILAVEKVLDAVAALGYGLVPLDTPRRAVPMHLQEAFVGSARLAMGQPMLEDIEDLVGRRVVIEFNHSQRGKIGILTSILHTGGGAHLVLDGNEDDPYPLNSIQAITRQD